jgi:hypothetical protein
MMGMLCHGLRSHSYIIDGEVVACAAVVVPLIDSRW